MDAVLSIIIANYNNEKHVRECLDSVLGQTYRDFEVVIADDCSSDASPDIIGEYVRQWPDRIRAVYLATNHGVSYARHSAIAAARGKYITTLDSDDYYYASDKLEKEMAVIYHYLAAHKKTVCAFSNTVLIADDGTFLQETCSADTLQEGMILECIATRTCAIPRDFIMPRDAYFDVGGFDLALNLYEDWDLKIRLASKYEFFFSGAKGTAYRRHRDGLSSAPIQEHVKTLNMIFANNIHRVAEKNRMKLTAQFNTYLQELLSTAR